MVSPRHRLPNRRQSFSFEFQHMTSTYHCSLSYGPWGGIGEVFLLGGKPGSDMEAATRDLAVITSLALQHGCTVQTIRDALTQREGGAAGPLGVMFEELEGKS